MKIFPKKLKIFWVSFNANSHDFEECTLTSAFWIAPLPSCQQLSAFQVPLPPSKMLTYFMDGPYSGFQPRPYEPYELCSEIKTEGMTVFLWSCKNGHTAIAKMLIEYSTKIYINLQVTFSKNEMTITPNWVGRNPVFFFSFDLKK